jgi:hypothetical protein
MKYVYYLNYIGQFEIEYDVMGESFNWPIAEAFRIVPEFPWTAEPRRSPIFRAVASNAARNRRDALGFDRAMNFACPSASRHADPRMTHGRLEFIRVPHSE